MRYGIIALYLMFCHSAIAYESANQTKIGLLNWQLVQNQSDAWQKFLKKLNEEVILYQSDIKKQENEIRQRQQNLQKEHEQIAKDVFQKKQRDIQNATLQLAKLVDIKKRQLDEIYKINDKFMIEHIRLLSDELAKKYKIDMVINYRQANDIILYRDTLEITGEILNLLNYKIKEIPWTNPSSIVIKDAEGKPLVPLNNPINNVQ